MKVVYVSGTRADYGLMKSVLKSLDKEMELEIVATGMHLMKEFGHSIDVIEKDGFKISKVDAVCEKDSKASMSEFLGRFIQGFTERVLDIDPDFIIVLGDRAEMLGAACVGTYLLKPVAHIHGGDVSMTVDEHARHAITKLSHIHLAATEKSAERIKKMGEDPSRVHVVGAPGVASIKNQELLSKKQIEKKFKIDLEKPLLLVLQHPVSGEENSGKQIEQTLEAVKDYQTIVIYPNADAGGREMIEIIEGYLPSVKAFDNLEHKDFISLMSVADVLIGNSSSGMIEAPSFKLPVVNIGSRQRGRERSINIIDCSYDEKEIKKAIDKALSKDFKEKMKKCENLYYKEGTEKKICEVLLKTKLETLQKQLVY